MFANRMDRTVWRGGWREIGGYKKYYRSRWEANYARYLTYLQGEGRVASWAHEPKTFWFEGIKRGVTNYLPDFQVIYPDGREEYHEVKGWMDSKSATKIKRMKIYHPTVCLVVVDKNAYMKLEKEFCTTIEGWELITKENGSDSSKGEVKNETSEKAKKTTRRKKKNPEIDPSLEDEGTQENGI